MQVSQVSTPDSGVMHTVLRLPEPHGKHGIWRGSDRASGHKGIRNVLKVDVVGERVVMLHMEQGEIG